MMTNILQALHTTAAYQTAAMQLMVGEANFYAKQLELNEVVPAVASMPKDWDVEPPPDGVGGTVTSPNYTFYFHHGTLQSINKFHWLQKISPPVNDMFELAQRPSSLDTNSAYQLATQRLAAISVDVAELERRHSPIIFQVPGGRARSNVRSAPNPANIVWAPLFEISWGHDPKFWSVRTNGADERRLAMWNRRPDYLAPVFVKLLGTTREILEVSVRDASLLRRPALELSKKDQLLGPTPPPAHFVEEFLGGKEAYETVAHPDKVEAWLLTSGLENKRDRTGPVGLDAIKAKAFSDALLDFDSYLWRKGKMCIMDEGARLRFTRGKDTVDVRLCYECDMLAVVHNGKMQDGDFDPGHDALVKALQAAFLDDAIVQGLPLKGSHPK